VQQYRNRLRIIADVLSAAMSFSGEGGASPTALMRRSNLSHHGLEQLLSQLLSAGFMMEKKEERGSTRYLVSARGCEYLAQYRQFESFTESYGLHL